MKFIDLIKTANRNLNQAKLRSTLTILAIVIGAFTFTLTTAAGEGLKQYVSDQAVLIHAPNTLIATKGQTATISGVSAQPTQYDPTSSDFGLKIIDAQDLETMRHTANVIKVQPSPPVNAEYLSYGNKKYKTLTSEFLPTMQFSTSAGNLRSVGTMANGLALGYGFVEALGFRSPEEAIGKEITFVFKDQLKQSKSYRFVVKAVLANSLVLNTQALINLPILQTISEWQASGVDDVAYGYTTASIFLKSGLTAEQQTVVEQTLQAKGINASTYEDGIKQLTQSIGQLQTALGVFSAIAILAAAFGIVNTLYMAVTERTREVGLLKALGMRNRRIFGLFAFEAALLGLWGSLVGILAAVGLGFGLNSVLGNTLQSTLPGYRALVFPSGLLIGVLAGITALALLAGTFPALKAMRQDPITALRYE